MGTEIEGRRLLDVETLIAAPYLKTYNLFDHARSLFMSLYFVFKKLFVRYRFNSNYML